jgi:hypothetical protein
MPQIKIGNGVPQPQGPGEDPLLYYTKLFVRFLQLIFATFEKGAYHWSEDPENTEILIAGQGGETREVAEQRPAIIVARGSVNYLNLTLDQLQSYDPISGLRKHAVMAAGSVIFQCCASVALEAGRIAHITDWAVKTHKRTLMKAGLHRVGEESVVGTESPPGSIVQGDPREVIMVPVSIPFYFPQIWTIEPIDKVLLKNLSLTLRSDIDWPASGATVVKGPGINGKPLTYTKLVSLTEGIKVSRLTTPKPRK